MISPINEDEVLADLRSRFLDREVQVVKTNHQVEIGGEKYDMPYYDSQDPILTEIAQEITTMGWKVRLWLPDTVGTMDYRMDRINVYVMETSLDKFAITSIRIG